MPHALPTYRLHRPSGQAVVTLNGRDFYLGPWKSPESRVEFDRLLGEWIANGRRLPARDAQHVLTVAELLLAYLRFAKEYYRSDTGTTSEFTSICDAVKPLRDLYAKTPVPDFGPLALRAVRERMIDRKLCRTSINRRTNRIRRVFRWGVEHELVPSAVFHALQAVAPLKRGRTGAPESAPVQAVPDEHVDAVLPLVARAVASMIRLQRWTGMRPGEVVRLRPADVDRGEDVWIYRPPQHKTAYRGTKREIFLGPRAQAELAPWLLRAPEDYCFSPREAEAERNAKRREQRQTPMTPSQARRNPKRKPQKAKRERYTTCAYNRAIQYGIRRAGVPHWHANQLRHSCGTEVRRRYGLDGAQLILGHAVCDVTQVYAERDRGRALEIARQIG